MSYGAITLSSDPTAGGPGRTATTAPGAAKTGQALRPGAAATGDSLTLSPQAKAVVAQLQARDADVRAHEEAHVAAGGGLITSAVAFTYEKGPDGRMYAVGGDVGIDASAVSGNPSATLAKAQQVEAAALAPADPSSQDVAVAGAAAAMAAQASAQLTAGQGRTAPAGSASPKGGAQAVSTAAPGASPASGYAAAAATAPQAGGLFNAIA